MTATCNSYIQGLVMRLTRLDECGAVVGGTCAYAVSTGFVQVEPETDMEDGEVIEQTKANGERCYYKRTQSLLNSINLDIEFCSVDPELHNIATGDPLVLDDAVSPVAHGYTVNSGTFASANFALEIWTDLYPNACATSGGRRWGYALWPWLHDATVTIPTIENGGANFSVTGAKSKAPNQWGTGPYDIQYAADGVTLSGLYTALDPDDHFLLWKVNIAPPTEACGCQTLILPSS